MDKTINSSDFIENLNKNYANEVVINGTAYYSLSDIKAALYNSAAVNHECKCEADKSNKDGEWISCKEQLPPYGSSVLVYLSSTGFVRVWKRVKGIKKFDCWMNEHGEYREFKNVDYWQYLPELPNK